MVVDVASRILQHVTRHFQAYTTQQPLGGLAADRLDFKMIENFELFYGIPVTKGRFGWLSWRSHPPPPIRELPSERNSATEIVLVRLSFQ